MRRMHENPVEMPGWLERLGGLKVENPYTKAEIDLSGLQCVDVCENGYGRMSVYFACFDGAVPATSFFMPEKQLWIHVNLGGVPGLQKETTMTERDAKGRFVTGNTMHKKATAARKAQPEVILHGPRRLASYAQTMKLGRSCVEGADNKPA